MQNPQDQLTEDQRGALSSCKAHIDALTLSGVERSTALCASFFAPLEILKDETPLPMFLRMLKAKREYLDGVIASVEKAVGR